MKFIVDDKTYLDFINAWKVVEQWKVVRIEPQPPVIVALFVGGEDERYIPRELAPLLAGDYCDFLNDKYIDKEFNEEWDEPDREKRIKYHEEQLKILKNDDYVWNTHGSGV